MASIDIEIDNSDVTAVCDFVSAAVAGWPATRLARLSAELQAMTDAGRTVELHWEGGRIVTQFTAAALDLLRRHGVVVEAPV